MVVRRQGTIGIHHPTLGSVTLVNGRLAYPNSLSSTDSYQLLVEQVVYCSFPFALLVLYAAVSPISHSPCHAPYAPDSTIMRYHASI
jgi:hypothetical protein